MSFGGETFDEAQDGDRLRTQFKRVFELMKDSEWRTLSDIHAEMPEASEAAISARLRDFRKDKFGGHTVDRRRVPGERGLFEYRLLVRQEEAA